MPIIEDEFGTTSDGDTVKIFILTNGVGTRVTLITFGAAITKIELPDVVGKVVDIVCGYDSVQGYEDNPCYFGVVVGRCANRIAGGKFKLNGVQYQLDINNGPNHNHGGKSGGFAKRLWAGEVVGEGVRMTYTSPADEDGYPGTLTCHVTYELTENNELFIRYSATADAPTIVNLTSHSYFNLAGHKTPNIYDNTLLVPASHYTPKDATNVPTGEVHAVSGALDLTRGAALGACIPHVPLSDPDDRPGFDHNYCLSGDLAVLAARLIDPVSGRCLECRTDQKGLQVYTANWVEDVLGKDGTLYGQHCAVGLETQNYPDAVNKPHFPSCVLKPGETYSTSTVYKFCTQP